MERNGVLVMEDYFNRADPAMPLDVRMAVGYGGQFIFVVPARNTTVAAATSWSSVRNADTNFMLVLTTIVDTILPSLG